MVRYPPLLKYFRKMEAPGNGLLALLIALLIARMFYVDYIELGQPKKASFVLRTDDQLSMFF